MTYILIKGSTNDSESVSQMTEITPSFLEKIEPLIEAIEEFEPYQVTIPSTKVVNADDVNTTTVSDDVTWEHSSNFNNGEYIRPDLGELRPEELYAGTVSDETLEKFIVDCVPFNIQNIDEISIYEVTSHERLL